MRRRLARKAASRDRDGELAKLAKALAHPTRVRILRLLLRRNACVCGEVVEELEYAQSTVSEHLRILKQAGLVKGTIEGPRTCYCARREAVERLHGLTAALDRLARAEGVARHRAASERGGERGSHRGA